MHVRFAADPAAAKRTVHVALAPGLVVGVGVAEHRVLELGDAVEIAGGRDAVGTIALDGEREIERRAGGAATVRLVPGPLTIDVDAVMRSSAGDATPAQPPPG
jgi:hypothetical protein